MSEAYDEIVAIERGDMSDEDWDSMQKMAVLYRGRLVTEQVFEQSIDSPDRPDDSEN